MSGKKRTCNEAFIIFGFTSIVQNSEFKPQCVICTNVLSHESMKPSKLKVHFEACHSNLSDKEFDWIRFGKKEASLKVKRIDFIGRFAQQNEAALEATGLL